MADSCIKKVVTLTREKYSNPLIKKLQYGTAGFRDEADLLPHVMFRMGLLAVLRSKNLKGATIGVMITASHNPEKDNGVKLCDPTGEFLTPDWEKLATELANTKDYELEDFLMKIIDDFKIVWNTPASVFLGRDTRASSPHLAEAVCVSVKAFEGTLTDLGLVTTPQLHYVVFCKNTDGQYGAASIEGYCKKFSSAFLSLYSGDHKSYTNEVFVDAANGIGAQALKKLIPYLNDCLKFTVFNDGDGALNHKCGADHVKIQQTVPTGLEIISGNRYASFDGDADRLVYFYIDDDKTFHILDGDKIAALIAKCLKELIYDCDLNLNMCVVQTAYANGNSTRFIENTLGIPVICVPTGVKHLHHEAKKHEIGIYFEANGHGTVVFQDQVKLKIKNMSNEKIPDKQRNSCLKLLSVVDLINETVGDAISDLLVVEAFLCQQGWSIFDWDNIYSDIPYRQMKVKVANKNIITTCDNERKCKTPLGLQEAIDELISKYQNARAFIRPSGTEDIVRIYSEADTQDNADLLAKEISALIIQLNYP